MNSIANNKNNVHIGNSALNNIFPFIRLASGLATSPYYIVTSNCYIVTSHYYIVTSTCYIVTSHYNIVTSTCYIVTSPYYIVTSN